ncbi:MAG: hypothetical protein E5V75_24000 [Mesorhizobium sp.]|nr:MAG: hypothetical protein E5V75_24000 [Mesorhizobium sp.]
MIFDPGETVAVLRQVETDQGTEMAMDEACLLILGAVAFLMRQDGHHKAEEVLRQVLDALPKH